MFKMYRENMERMSYCKEILYPKCIFRLYSTHTLMVLLKRQLLCRPSVCSASSKHSLYWKMWLNTLTRNQYLAVLLQASASLVVSCSFGGSLCKYVQYITKDMRKCRTDDKSLQHIILCFAFTDTHCNVHLQFQRSGHFASL